MIARSLDLSPILPIYFNRNKFALLASSFPPVQFISDTWLVDFLMRVHYAAYANHVNVPYNLRLTSRWCCTLSTTVCNISTVLVLAFFLSDHWCSTASRTEESFFRKAHIKTWERKINARIMPLQLASRRIRLPQYRDIAERVWKREKTIENTHTLFAASNLVYESPNR